MVDAGGGRAVVELVLPYRDGRCRFLGGDDRCTIYADRPLSCREFECVRGYAGATVDPRRQSEFLRRNPAVVAIIEAM